MINSESIIIMLYKYLKCILYILIVSPLLVSADLYGQKPPITNSTFETWPEIKYPKISDNGDYVLYTIASSKSDTVVLQSTIGSNVYKFVNARDGEFACRSRYVVFINAHDSLVIVNLKTFQIDYFSGVKG